MEKKNRMAWLVRGLMVLLGIYFWFRRDVALPHMTWLLAAGLLIHGLMEIVSRVARRLAGAEHNIRLAGALISLLLGLVLLRHNRQAAVMVPLIIGLWACVMGAVKVIVGVQYRDAQEPGWWGPLLSGLVSLVFGYFMLTDLAAGMVASSMLIGLYLIFYGLSDAGEWVVMLLTRRKRHEEA